MTTCDTYAAAFAVFGIASAAKNAGTGLIIGICFSTAAHTDDVLSTSQSFVKLSQNEKAQVLSGRKPAFKMESPHILEPSIESAIFNLLSNSVHGLPLGLVSNSFNLSPYYHDFFRTEHLLALSLMVCRIYTAHVVKDYLDLRKRLYSLLEQAEKDMLRSYMSSKDLEDCIEAMEIQYSSDPFFDFPTQ